MPLFFSTGFVLLGTLVWQCVYFHLTQLNCFYCLLSHCKLIFRFLPCLYSFCISINFNFHSKYVSCRFVLVILYSFWFFMWFSNGFQRSLTLNKNEYFLVAEPGKDSLTLVLAYPGFIWRYASWNNNNQQHYMER